MGEAWIIDAVRTPRGKGKAETGALSGIHPQELMAQALNALRDRTRMGATGAMLIGTILDELERQDKTTGLITMCIGGGMGIASIIERI